MDPLSGITVATGVGSSLGLILRIIGYITRKKEKRENQRQQRKLKRQGANHQQILDFQKQVDNSDVQIKEVELDKESVLSLFGKPVIGRRTQKKGKTPVYSLRQHAINFTVYLWVPIIGITAFLLLDNPERTLWVLDPNRKGFEFDFLFFGFQFPRTTLAEVTTGWVGLILMQAMIGIISFLVTGFAGRK